MNDAEFHARAKDIAVLLSDVDGVLTDGGMYYTRDGDELKKFNVRDGVGILLLRQVGVRFGAMTGECIELVERRMRKLRADYLYMGVSDKAACLDAFLTQYEFDAKQVAYVGDEINDLTLIDRVGLFFAPKDANRRVLEKAHRVVATPGGRGVLREVAELLLDARGEYEHALASFLNNSRSTDQPGAGPINVLDATEPDSIAP